MQKFLEQFSSNEHYKNQSYKYLKRIFFFELEYNILTLFPNCLLLNIHHPCLQIEKHNLDMKLIDVEYTFDHNKILFYFTADGRVDFRELVRDLASVFKTRIELRQIGVRDEAKMIGGLGVCGRVLCCNSYLGDFEPVSIKMVKEQNLSLNPTKISGTCGRLMCCLKNEQAVYEALSKNAPGVGTLVDTCDGKGTVTAVNIFKGTVSVAVGETEKSFKDYKIKDIKILKKGSRKDEEKIDMSELKQLED